MTAPAALRPAWKYTFVDFLTRRTLAPPLPLVDADLAEIIGGPAAGTGAIPLASEEVRGLDPWAATTPRRTLCFARRQAFDERDRKVSDRVMWAGVVWKREPSGRHLKLTMSTVESYWARRLVAADRTFSWVDDAAILRQVLADAEAVPNGALGVDLGSDTVGTRSDRTITAADAKTVLETATSIATNGGGFDWRIVPGADPSGRYTLTYTAAHRFGRTDPRERTWTSAPDGRPGNELVGYTLVEDGTNVPTETVAYGGGQGPERLSSTVRASGELDAGYPLTQNVVSLSTTGDLITQAAIDRHAQATHDAARQQAELITGLTVRGDRGVTVDRYGLGDVVRLRLRDLLHPTPREFRGRIVGRRILPDQPGRNETVAMTLEPAA